ncbi:MAG: zinc ribbon domain-containing protein [Methanobacteriota archaeon]
MICPACGTQNRDEALFCKYCGANLPGAPAAAAAPRPAPPVEPTTSVPTRVPPAPGQPPRPWWHALGVLVILVAFLAFVDVAMDGRITWSLVATLGLTFLAGGVLILQFLASPDRRDRRPFVVGVALLAAAVILIPVSLAAQSSATTTQTITVPYDPTIANLNLTATVDTGQVQVDFVPGTAFLLRAQIVHVGGLFSSHTEGDLVQTNTTRGDTLAFELTARSTPGFLFAGGHDVRVTIRRDLSVDLQLHSTTGSVSVDASAGVDIRGIVATVTTGSVSVTSRDVTFADAASVQATSTTGGVTIDIAQAGGDAGTVALAGTSTTGGVTFRFDPGAGVAARVQSSVTTGTITFDPSKFQGTEALLFAPSEGAYNAAELRFNVQLASTTGSVTVG